MSKEGSALQYDLFSGELVDARSDYQKKKDRERAVPQQTQMFRTPDMVQFGAKKKSVYRDWLDKTTAPPLVLESQDTRTPEEIELDLVREAQKQTIPLFGYDTDTSEIAHLPEPPIPPTVVIFDRKTHNHSLGLRKQLRRESISVRSRHKAV